MGWWKVPQADRVPPAIALTAEQAQSLAAELTQIGFAMPGPKAEPALA
jgi:hypothetical protein